MTMCGVRHLGCVCDIADDHEGPHECPCGGKWLEQDGVMMVFAWPSRLDPDVDDPILAALAEALPATHLWTDDGPIPNPVAQELADADRARLNEQIQQVILLKREDVEALMSVNPALIGPDIVARLVATARSLWTSLEAMQMIAARFVTSWVPDDPVNPRLWRYMTYNNMTFPKSVPSQVITPKERLAILTVWPAAMAVDPGEVIP